VKNNIKIILSFPLKLVFIYPAKIILWYRYFFPSKSKKGGFVGIAESRRQYKEGGTLIYVIISCGFWGTTVMFLLLMAGGGH